MAIVFSFLVGVIVGLAAMMFFGPKIVGTIRLVSSQPGELPSMYVELNRPVEDVIKHTMVRLNISHK